MSPLKCLSVKQPYASLIMSGRKQLEIRSWKTSHRGVIGICASAVPDKAAVQRLDMTGPLGCFLGIVEIMDCRPFTPQDVELAFTGQHYPSQWAWVLADPLKITEPIPIKGALGLFTLVTNPAIKAAMLKSLNDASVPHPWELA